MLLQMAAMALSPIAAMSLALTSETWQDSMRDFAERLRDRMRLAVDKDTFQARMQGLDNSMTFMDWTYKLTGVDLTHIWDPELWVKFKEAVWNDQPQVFWNELMDRIEYSEYLGGLAIRQQLQRGQADSKLSAHPCLKQTQGCAQTHTVLTTASLFVAPSQRVSFPRPA